MKYLIVALAVILAAAPAMASRTAQDFMLIDADGDGYITLEELTSVQEKTLDRQNADTFKLLDADEDGAVSKSEYIEFYSKVAANQPGEAPDLGKNFDALDTDRNGKLSMEELAAFRSGVKDTTNQMAINVMDTDKDGRVSRQEYDEFVKSMEELFKNFSN